jgi:D-alanine-D-alanine ligase
VKTLAIITGGKSPEHDVAIISSRNIFKAVDTTQYEIKVVGISKSGQWYLLPDQTLFEEGIKIGEQSSHLPLCVLPFDDYPIRLQNGLEPVKIDVFFPIAHGVYGEDGILQGVLENTNKPYVGPGVLGSAIGMDKDVAKQLLAYNGIQVTPWLTLYKGDEIPWANIEALGFPVFVKPANMGSGVGVEKASTLEELKSCIERAFTYDIKLLIEKGINGREVETAVLGNLKTKGTGVGEIIVESGFYTYENKYINAATKVVIPAENLSEASIALIQSTALKAYRVLQLEGMSRVDFFYVNDDTFYLNEVNTLPGFTNISMYPKLWEAAGLPYTALISELIAVAIERFNMRQSLNRSL